MHIEFTCLHCGRRLKVPDEKAGSRSECPECGQTVTVPRPIGGKLTGKRIRESPAPEAAPSAPSLSAAPPPRESLTSRTIHASEVERRDGVVSVNWQLNALCRRTERELIEGAIQAICDDLRTHMQLHPQHYESANLVLNVEEFEINADRKAASVLLVGWLNGTQFTDSVSVWYSGRMDRRPMFLLLNLIASGLRFKELRQAVTVRLLESLDDSVGRRLNLWQRIKRRVRTAFHG